MTEPKDPGAYIGQEPEREAETIPGGVKPGDERIAAYNAAPGVRGEPEAPSGDDAPQTEMERMREAGLNR